MVSSQQVKCLEEVVRTRSFRAAASSLGLSQPTVSENISRLERELDLTLLQRTHNGSALTDAGERILPHLRAFVDTTAQIWRASEHLQSTAQQHLTLAGETRRLHRALPEAIAHMTTTFENLNLRMTPTDLDGMYAELGSGGAELGVFVRVAGTDVTPDEFETIPVLGLGPVGIALPHHHPALGHEGPIHVSELRGYPLILTPWPKTIDITDQVFPLDSRGPVSLIDDIGLGLDLVRHGLGMMLTTGITCYLHDERVTWRAIEGVPELELCVARLRSSPPSPVGRAFVEFLGLWCARCAAGFRYDPVSGVLHASEWIDQWLVRGREGRGDAAVGGGAQPIESGAPDEAASRKFSK
ncbi:MAG: LysR family transcriptional regulator [Ilumatobacteraceae bacterium]|nr:LysR family transcriptional regulator [Ilumatobacteraceae bacterium]MCU1388010.1 LysR family transcriptional regulator [Ilumatobacteraceae bacterium]